MNSQFAIGLYHALSETKSESIYNNAIPVSDYFFTRIPDYSDHFAITTLTDGMHRLVLT